jgi:hypothetical protein
MGKGLLFVKLPNFGSLVAAEWGIHPSHTVEHIHRKEIPTAIP